jgi:hypothetical protein
MDGSWYKDFKPVEEKGAVFLVGQLQMEENWN